MRQKGPFRRLSQVLAVALVPAIVLTSVPVQAAPPPAAQTETQAPPETPVDTPPPPAPEVTVNRTVPEVTPVAVIPVFSDPPTDAEVFRARLFTEPFVPLGETSADENRALAEAILEYRLGTDDEDVSAFGTFLFENPRSAWRASVITNLGAHYRRTGYYTKATDSLAEAWALAKNDTTPMGKATAARALSELLDIHMQFGKVEDLEALTAEVEGRDMSGGVVQRLAQADRAIWVLKHAHHEAIASAAVSVDNLMGYGKKDHKQHPEVAKFHATPQGAALSDVHALTRRVGLRTQMARRDGGDFVVPSIVHLKAGHFTALVKQDGDRFLLSDPMLGGEVWMSRAALQEEASGYSLLPAGRVRAGWRNASAGEVRKIRGKCVAAMPNYGCTTPDCGKTGGGPPCQGMATYRFHSLLVSLSLTDIPVGYAPPRGPAIQSEVTYNQREAYQPAIFPFSNFGPRWNFAWLAYIEDTPSNLSAPANVHPPGGGLEIASGFSVDRYLPDFDSRAVIVRTSSSPIRYERQLPDGSMEVYSQPDSGVSPRRVFLTERRDPAGNAAQLTYDGQLRVAAVTDAIGQVSTLTYGLSDPLLITKVADPFGRSATFDYNSEGRLIRITDVIGITSEFEYGNDDFIRALTTPYGTTTFAQGQVTVGFPDYYPTLWVEATDPLGGTERIEYDWHAPELAASDPANTVPKGFVNNVNLDRRNTYYWDKRAMALHPGDHTKARLMHWLWSPTSAMKVYDALHSEKLPLENRVWYGQMGEAVGEGSSPQGQPAKIGRVLDDGSSQIYRYEYNAKGYVTRSTDPVGRETMYEYDANDTHLLAVKQKNGTNWDKLASYTYNSAHQVVSATDAAGQTTSATYNGNGMLATVLTPSRGSLSTANRTTSYSYFADSAASGPGRIETITGPLGATMGYTYDQYGRAQTVTYPDGYALTFAYDSLDRPTITTFPDGTFEQTIYKRLDAETTRDRAGQWTHRLFDALRRVVATRDPLGRTMSQSWCTCGSLDKMVDASGNITTWEQDVQGRRIKEIRANGSEWNYAYENTTSRLKQVTDPKNQVRNYQYFIDGKLKQVSFTNALYSTPTVTFTYDSVYRRLATMTDGSGITTLTYNSIATPPSLGAGQLYSVDGPGASDTIIYAYDELGRRIGRTIDGETTSYGLDALHRVSSVTHPVGTFSLGYSGVTARRTSLGYPNGTSTTYAYMSGTSDPRLEEIHHKLSGGATLAKFNYTYDEIGNLKTWRQQDESNAAKIYDLGYDVGDQLVTAIYRTTDATPTILKRYAYSYDSVGNRTTEQIDDAPLQGTFDNMNRLTSEQPAGVLRFGGSTNEAASVTIGGKPAATSAENAFSGSVAVASGTNSVVVMATDPVSNVRTSTYQVSIGGSTTTFTYDAVGNVTQRSDGTDTWGYEWYADNLLARVTKNTVEQARFRYDGRGRRYEKVAGGVTTTFTYDEEDVLREQTTAGSTYRYVHASEVDEPLARKDQSGTVVYYHVDHLGSVVKTTNGSGAVATTRRYDPFGRLATGASEAGYAYTGREWDPEISLFYFRARYYDPSAGQFISEDPLGVRRQLGVMYGYADGNPTRLRDPFGLDTAGCDLFKGSSEAPCELECCAAHDKCYDDYNCTSKSWRLWGDKGCNPKECRKCNEDVSKCEDACDEDAPDDPKKPNFYCAAQHRYITIPGDFPDRGTAEKACKYDHGKDCKK